MKESLPEGRQNGPEFPDITTITKEVVLVGTDRITGRKMAVRGIVNIN